jgi:outer membrane protein OmpA-like peptidoglycan-associated protein
MHPKYIVSAAILLIGASLAQAQSTQQHPANVPIYSVTVIGRTVSAVNYQYKTGPTEIGFHGTVLLPEGKGGAVVESKTGRTEIDAHFEHLAASQKFGAEYLTYVLWAITPEGNVRNLGEVLANGSDKAHTRVTTDLQAFGLIMTAEPYAAVRAPSDVVVMENEVRPDTIGGTQPIQARYEFMPRGTYTYNIGAGFPAAGPKVSMAEYEETIELYQALNAVQIAEAQAAGKYAPEVMTKARQQYEQARQLQIQKAGRSAIVTASRQAAQTAEDARALAAARKHDMELASAHSDVDREQQLRLKAEAAAGEAQATAVVANNALESERHANRELEARATAIAPPPPPPAPVALERPAVSAVSGDDAQIALRSRLLTQLRGPLETLDSGRGLVVTLQDSDFRGTSLSPAAAAQLARVAATVAPQQGLTIEVDGHSDQAGAAGETFSWDRAGAVKDALAEAGLQSPRITTRGLGNTRPFGSNATAEGKMENRRVEVVIHGTPIGESATWDKSYSLGPRAQQ